MISLLDFAGWVWYTCYTYWQRKLQNKEVIDETNRNIQIIAEGHPDLSRKLDESIKYSGEIKARQELHAIYINRHERMLTAL